MDCETCGRSMSTIDGIAEVVWCRHCGSVGYHRGQIVPVLVHRSRELLRSLEHGPDAGSREAVLVGRCMGDDHA